MVNCDTVHHSLHAAGIGFEHVGLGYLGTNTPGGEARIHLPVMIENEAHCL